jgi:DNA topoisomerase-1
VGKSGKLHELDLHGRRLAAIVKNCRDLPGYELFQYIDESGTHTTLDSGMVNDYLRHTASEDITAKDFRTWHGTVCAAEQLCACGASATETETKRNIVAAIKAVADCLGNRPATCRKYYVRPVVLELYSTGALEQSMSTPKRVRNSAGLAPAGRCVLKILLETCPNP